MSEKINFPPVVHRSLSRLHPCEVTSDRLLKHLERFYDETDGRTRDAIADVRQWLVGVAENHGGGW